MTRQILTKQRFVIIILAIVISLLWAKGASATIPISPQGDSVTQTDISATTVDASTNSLINKGGLSVPSPLSQSILDRLQSIQDAINKKKADEASAVQQAAQAIAEAARIAQAAQAVPSTAPAPTPVIQASVQSSDYYINWIIQHESGGNPYAVNPISGACGLFQRLPCTVTLGDVAGQMADGLTYINSRYGSAYNAYLYWVAHGNY